MKLAYLGKMLLSILALLLLLTCLFVLATFLLNRQYQQQMQQLQAQAQTLKKPSAVTRAEAIRWLEENIPTQLGAQTRWQLQGERLSVQLADTSPERLASWLGQARERAQALPVQAQLQRSPAEAAKPKAPNSASNATDKPELASHPVLWQGSLLLSLP